MDIDGAPLSIRTIFNALAAFLGRVAPIAAMLLIGAPAAAQRFEVHHYTVTDGLPSSNIAALHQDPQGRMWFATRAGIAVYDGTVWQHHDATPPPRHNFAITRWDARRRLWMAPGRVGVVLSWFRDGQWSTVPSPPAVRAQGDVTLMEATDRDGAPHVVIATDRGRILQWTGKRWRDRTPPHDSAVDSLCVTPHATYATLDGTLYAGEGEDVLTPVPLPSALPQPPFGGFLGCDKSDGTAWLIGPDWIAKVERDQVVPLVQDVDLPPLSLFRGHVALGPGGGLYVGYLDRVVRVHPSQGLQSLTVENGLVADGTTGMLRDREGNVWIASPRGASKIVSLRFASLESEHGLLADEVTAVLDRGSDGVVLGHVGGLTFVTESGIDTRTFGLSDHRGRVLDLDGDARGRLWVAMQQVGLAEIAPDGAIRWHLTDALPVFSVRVGDDGTVWASCNRGLYRGGSRGFDPVQPNVPVRARRLQWVGDWLYLASATGLYRLRDGALESLQNARNEPASSVFAVALDDDGTTWVGTAAGLMRLVDGDLRKASSPGPHTDRPVYFLTLDRDRRLWIGTDDGVIRWDGDRLARFSTDNGLIGRETNRAAGVLDRRGHLWIGTDRGVSIYRPEYDVRIDHPPLVALNEAVVGEKRYALDRPIELPPGPNTVQFGFRAVSLTNERRVRVQTRLDGFDTRWLEHSPPPESVRYTNLPPGEYRLVLRAANAEGDWSDSVVSEAIVVLGPFWQRPWFFAAMGLLVAGIGYVTHRFVNQRQYARRLEHEVRERVADVRQGEALLREVQEGEQRRIQRTLAAVADGVLAVDPTGRVLLINPAAERITGWSAEDAIGETIDTVMPLSDDEGAVAPREALTAVIRQGGMLELGDLSLRSRKGATVLVSLSAAAMRERADGPSTGAVLAFRDITEKRQIEGELAQNQRLEAVGLLAGGIAHDFNNLLTVVMGNLSSLRADPDVTHRHGPNLEAAEVAVERSRQLTQQLLTFSRGGAPVLQISSLSSIADECASLAMSGIDARCSVEVDDDVWPVRVDIGQIQQVVHNLLINAAQSMPPGGTVKLMVRNCATPPPQLHRSRYVEIAVRDEGCGIAATDIERVFDPFFSTKEGGRGLGLAAAHSIVRKHEGLLTVDSELGVGSTFTVYLPASSASSAAIDAAPGTQAAPCRHHVLVMDDEAAIREIVGELLESLGCTVEFAQDGAEALELYIERQSSDTPFDLVLMDLTVPEGIGGRETIARLLAHDPDAYVVVASGYSSNPVMADYASYGFRGCVRKPFGADDLEGILSQLTPRQD